jgi:streptogramin lyase
MSRTLVGYNHAVLAQALRKGLAIRTFPKRAGAPWAWPELPDEEVFMAQFLKESIGSDPTEELLLTSANLSVDASWAGGVLGPDGVIYCSPLGSPSVLMIDTKTGTASRTDFGLDLSAAAKFVGGALAPNGKIYFSPYTGTVALVIDVAAQTAELTDFGLNLTGNAKWQGMVMGLNGKLYSMPFASANVLEVTPGDPGTAVLKDFGLSSMSNPSKWCGGVLAPNGKIYGVPYASWNVLIIDPVADTAQRTDMGLDLSDSTKFQGGVLGVDGKIYCAPWSSTTILIIDPETNTAVRSAMGADLSGTNKWVGGFSAPDGKIYFMPYSAPDTLVIDPLAGTAERVPITTSPGTGYGGVMSAFGDGYMIPRATRADGAITRLRFNKRYSASLVLDPRFNQAF